MQQRNWSYSFRVWIYSVMVGAFYYVLQHELRYFSEYTFEDIFEFILMFLATCTTTIVISSLGFGLFYVGNIYIFRNVKTIFTGKIISTILTIGLMLIPYFLFKNHFDNEIIAQEAFFSCSLSMLFFIWLFEPNLK